MLTFFHEYLVFVVKNVWKLSQLDSLLQVALCQYFNIVIDRTKFFFSFIARDESEVVIHSDDAFAPVGFLHFKRMHVEQKELNEVWKNGRIVPDNINLLYLLSVSCILRNTGLRTWSLEFPIVTILGVDMDSF